MATRRFVTPIFLWILQTVLTDVDQISQSSAHAQAKASEPEWSDQEDSYKKYSSKKYHTQITCQEMLDVIKDT